MSSLTVNYGFYLPAEGDGRINGKQWHEQINCNFSTIDALLKANEASSAVANSTAESALAAAATAQETADGKIRCFFQPEAPTGMLPGDAGDLWFDTDDKNKPYRWSGAAWAEARDTGITDAILAAQTAQTTADGKAKIYYQSAMPTGLTFADQGDLWVDIDNNNKVWAWNGSTFILAQDWYAAVSAANAASAAAASAQSDANTANALHADIASDSKLTPVEKHKERAEWDKILGERSGIQAQADTFGVSRSAYDADFQALANYLNDGVGWISGVPSWLADANLGTTTTIVGATYRANWAALYDERQALLNAIADKARLNAAGAQSTANSAVSAAAYADRLARSSYNLIKNGNSEDANPTGPEAAWLWTTHPTWAYSGTKLRAVLPVPGMWNWAEVTGFIPCAPGEQYVFEAQTAADPINNAMRQIGISYFDAGGAFLEMVESGPRASDGWVGSGPPSYRKQIVNGIVPSGASYLRFVIGGAQDDPGGAVVGFDCLYAARKISAGMIEADAVQTVHLAAYSITAAKIATDAVKTSDYAEDAYGNPTAGAWMGVNTTNPIKCGPNGLQIGKGVFNQQSIITERIANGFFWKSAEGWGLTGTNAPVWSDTNPHTTGCGNAVSAYTGVVPAGEVGNVTATGSVSQVLRLGVPDPNATAHNLTLWLRSEYASSGTGSSFDGVAAYAKVYLTNLGSGGAETLIGTLSITTADTWTQGTFNLASVYTGAGAYGLRIEISSTTTASAGPSAYASVTASARLADVKFTA